MTALAFVDTETTGLDPDRNEVWEVGLILQDPDVPDANGEYLWHVDVDLGRADSMALTIGRFYERWQGSAVYAGRTDPAEPNGDGPAHFVSAASFAPLFARLTHGAHLVGAVPSFDDAFLKRLLRANGACPGWHYHLVDVEALAAGWLAAGSLPGERSAETFDKCTPPWNSNDLSRAVGVNPDDYERHTALGDARWAKAIYEVVMGR